MQRDAGAYPPSADKRWLPGSPLLAAWACSATDRGEPHFLHYNFARVHKSLRVTPAMQAGIASHVWSIEEIVNLVPEPEAKKRGPYKPRQSIGE